MAKHLMSAYWPRKRGAAWKKIKPRPRGPVKRATFFRIEISGPEWDAK